MQRQGLCSSASDTKSFPMHGMVRSILYLYRLEGSQANMQGHLYTLHTMLIQIAKHAIREV
jgi:hypothetical protein